VGDLAVVAQVQQGGGKTIHQVQGGVCAQASGLSLI
jgi:hypothetical protein